jgi:hypothetical protein
VTVGYLATQPPSMTIEWPVTNDDASESGHATPSPISEGCPNRPIGSPIIRSLSFTCGPSEQSQCR